MTKKILICGASGFIGRNLFEHLSHNPAFDVFGTYLSRSNRHTLVNKAYPKLWKADFTDKYTAQQLTKGFDYIINAAAVTDGSGAINSDPGKYITNNIRINTNLIEAANSNNVKHFIFLSCTVMYPSSLIPHRENEYDLKLIHPKYFMGARMKVFFENLCKFYSSLGDTKYTAIRHTNVYGPYDKFDLKRGHVLSATVEKVMTATDKIVVWGQGQERRDFLYITDLIGFIEQALEKQESGFDLFNVSFGKTYSIKELAQKIVDLSGKKLSIDYDLTKSSIDTVISINNSKARRILGWRPAIDIDAGIRQTIDWYLKNKWSENG